MDQLSFTVNKCTARSH